MQLDKVINYPIEIKLGNRFVYQKDLPLIEFISEEYKNGYIMVDYKINKKTINFIKNLCNILKKL